MDAWEILINHSSITSGNAWEYLNAQSGTPNSGVQPDLIGVTQKKIRIKEQFEIITLYIDGIKIK